MKTREQLKAWRQARIQNYANTRSLSALAQMVVELEDGQGLIPEFEYDEPWPTAVEPMRIK